MKSTSRDWRSLVPALILLVVGAGFLLLGLSYLRRSRDITVGALTPTATVPSATPAATATEPILPLPPTHSPTPTPAPVTAQPTIDVSAPSNTANLGVDATLTLAATATSTPTPTGTPTISPTYTPKPTTQPVQPGLYSLRQRLGVGGASVQAMETLSQEMGFGWYLDWDVNSNGLHSAEVEYVPMIRLQDGQPQPSGQALLEAVDALPGALWLIGNEPDVKWQDNVTPERYAEAYHDLYLQLKARDPSCQVAIGGVSQPTPLRLRYLDLILEAYQDRYGDSMPVDVWNVHNFILREERDSWGVDIPPGMTESSGDLREISDHDSLAIFEQQIVDFRRWMKEHGQQDKPLIVTEYGILMPNDYGFSPERVRQFMLDTFELFRTAADPALGYPADGYRLVQRWCWFSLADDRYPTGDLTRRDNGSLTLLGKAFREYAFSAH